MGRTWEEFIDFCGRFKAVMRPGCKCVVYVHNLSYEFQFLRGIYDFKPEEVFATEARRVLKCSMFGAFDLRCSYMLTNMSLARFTQSMGVEHGKLSGAEFDYSKMRYPWTELTEYERQYCANDVLATEGPFAEWTVEDGYFKVHIPGGCEHVQFFSSRYYNPDTTVKGGTVCDAMYKIKSNDRFVRAEIVGFDKKTAYTQYHFIDGGSR